MKKSVLVVLCVLGLLFVNQGQACSEAGEKLEDTIKRYETVVSANYLTYPEWIKEPTVKSIEYVPGSFRIHYTQANPHMSCEDEISYDAKFRVEYNFQESTPVNERYSDIIYIRETVHLKERAFALRINERKY